MTYQENPNRRLPLKVYVAGEYSADNVISVLKNIGRGESFCTMLFKMGFAPFCPWHDAQYAKHLWYQEPSKQEFYDASLAWLSVSDAMLVISGQGKGGGVDAEIAFAKERDIPVFYSTDALCYWRDEK